MKHKTKSSSPPKSGQSGSEKGSSRSSSPHDDSIDLKDIPIRLPEFTEIDHAKSYPTVSSIVNCNDVSLSLEELNSLQAELEGLLASTALRKKVIVDEKEIVDNLEKYKGQTKLFRKQPSSPKRGFSGGEVRNSKKLKLTSVKQSESRLASNIRVKIEQDTENEVDKRVHGEPSKGYIYKNGSAEKFWSFVKPYSTPITISHIEMVKDLIASHSENSDLLKVPKLGIHYSKTAPDDQENEQFRRIPTMQNASSTENKQGPTLDLQVISNKPEESPFGDHTQRLISALLEDDTMGPPDESLERGKKNSESDSPFRCDFIKSLDIRNAQALEARILNELKEIGVLDSNDDDEENDEVLTELKKCQEEFKVIAERHNPILNGLLNVATTELLRQQLRDRLQAADREVMETFQKIGVSRSKRGSLSKKEREQAWKVLKEREIIQKQLEGV